MGMHITNQSGKKYNFEGVSNISVRNITTNITINAPGKGSDEAIAINLNGVQKIVSFNFTLHKRTSDAAEGTHSSTVQTIDEQFIYLDRYVITGDFEEEYTLYWERDEILLNMTGMVDDLTLSMASETDTTYEGSMSITRGTNPFNMEEE